MVWELPENSVPEDKLVPMHPDPSAKMQSDFPASAETVCCRYIQTETQASVFSRLPRLPHPLADSSPQEIPAVQLSPAPSCPDSPVAAPVSVSRRIAYKTAHRRAVYSHIVYKTYSFLRLSFLIIVLAFFGLWKL